jgi:histone deacetylase complex regulatory component SIN3
MLEAHPSISKAVNIDFKSGYYKPMLKLIDRYFDKDVDQDEFEECARYIYGNQAYLLFTIDMVMASIINQVSSFLYITKVMFLTLFCSFTLLSLNQKHKNYYHFIKRIISMKQIHLN